MRPDYEAADEKKMTGLVEKFVKGATISSLSVLGKKHLSYPIKKFSEGIYVLVMLSTPHLDSAAMEKEMKMGTDIIRYLITAK